AARVLLDINVDSARCQHTAIVTLSYERGGTGVSLLAAPQSPVGSQLARLVAWGVRRGEGDRPPDSPFDLSGLVSLVPRDGRNDLFASERDRHHQPRVRARPRRQ